MGEVEDEARGRAARFHVARGGAEVVLGHEGAGVEGDAAVAVVVVEDDGRRVAFDAVGVHEVHDGAEGFPERLGDGRRGS